MKVEVIRGSGGKPSPDVLVDVLCTQQNIGVLKGKTYLYDIGFDVLLLELELKEIRNIICGDIIEFYDPDYGVVIKGRIISWSNRASISDNGETEIRQTMTVKKYLVEN